MARTRLPAGVYVLKALTGVGGELIIDDKPIDFTGAGETATFYAKNFLSFGTGKLDFRYLAENKDGISGQATI